MGVDYVIFWGVKAHSSEQQEKKIHTVQALVVTVDDAYLCKCISKESGIMMLTMREGHRAIG